MQSVSARIWTRVAVSISYDDNHYTTGTSITIIIILSFSRQRLQMIFHWSLSDSQSPQVSRTLLSILADLDNAVVILAGLNYYLLIWVFFTPV